MVKSILVLLLATKVVVTAAVVVGVAAAMATRDPGGATGGGAGPAFTFLTVKGAGHMVPKDRPRHALDMLAQSDRRGCAMGAAIAAFQGKPL